MNIVYYHGHCQDGLMSAAVLNNYFAERGEEATFIDAHYGKTTPSFEDLKGVQVYVVDFTFPLQDMLDIAAVADKVIWLDHHKTQQETYAALKDDGRFNIVFDMERSGCGITWDYLYPEESRPPFVAYAEDHDLWTFKLPAAREVNAWLRTQEMTLNDYSYLVRKDEHDLDWMNVKNLGKTILETQRAMYADICNRGHWVQCQFLTKSLDTKIPGAETTVGTSEVGEMLYELYPDAPFSLTYHQQDNYAWKYSLRSHKERGVDVSVLAKTYGGGGHKNAAGFILRSPPTLLGRLKP